MKLKLTRKPLVIMTAAVVACSVIVQGSGPQNQLQVTRSLSLRSETILDEHTEPVLSGTGQIGFVSSTTAGSLISFNTETGKILSSVVVGEGAARCSMIEKGSSRLIAVPCANAPGSNRPATVSIIDASDPRRLDPVSLIVLPAEAHLVSSAKALLTTDERYLVIPSYFEEPALFSFDVRTGQMISQVQLIGRPSGVSMFERTAGSPGGLIAVTSPVTNTVSMINIDDQGRLGQQFAFSQGGEGLDEDNNAAFSGDGQVVYVASSKTQQLLAIDASGGQLVSSIHVEPSPTRVTVASRTYGVDLIAVTRVAPRHSGAPGGVTIVAATAGRLSLQTEFTPPDPIQFSTSNNPAFTSDGGVAFVGSKSGVMFAFDTMTGELQSSQVLGDELMGLSVSDADRMIATVRRTAKSDQIIILSFGRSDTADAKSSADARSSEKSVEKAGAKKSQVPVINSLHPDIVEQGQLDKVRVAIHGSNFTNGASLLINGTTMIGAQMISPKVLIGKLPPQLLAEPGTINIQVQAADGTQSQPAALMVTAVQTPQISELSPAQVPGPHPPFELRVNGINFRATSVIVVAGQSLNTTLVSTTQLRAEIPLALSKQVAQLGVQIVDAASPGLVSNTVTLNVFGPVINQILPSRSPVIAGTGQLTMVIKGQNFRDDARVQIDSVRLGSTHVRVLSRGVIKAFVPASYIDIAGSLPVKVINGDGSASNAFNLDSLAPDIQSVDPGQIIAGPTDSSVGISGSNFRRHLEVKVGITGEQLRRVPVHFISDSKLVVILDSSLVSQPGSLTFQVINPGRGGGVASATKDVQLVGPNITDALLTTGAGKNAMVILTITGSSFAAGAHVQFLKEDQIELERAPDSIKANRVVLAVKASKLIGLGDYNVRVVNPGKIPSNQFQPHN